MTRITPLFGAALLLAMAAQESLKEALKDEVAGEEWIYDDYAAAVAAARESGKPILAYFR